MDAFGSNTLHGSRRPEPFDGSDGRTVLGPGSYEGSEWVEDRWGVETLRGSCIPGCYIPRGRMSALTEGLTEAQALDFAKRLTTRGVVPEFRGGLRLSCREVVIYGGRGGGLGGGPMYRVTRGRVVALR